MVVRNLVTGTSPGVLHRNGNPAAWQSRWPQIVEEFFREPHPPCEPCPELTILTWNSRPAKSLLERCLDARGIPHVVLGKQVTHWRPQVKPFLNAEALARVNTEYVMALDADDVLMVSCPTQILAEYMAFGCDIVFSAEKHSYPKVPFLYEFEKSIAETDYRHLNSGAWIGKTDACLRFFRECAKEDNADILAAHPAKHVLRDDQGLTRKTFRRFHPAARLDYHCRIFQSLYRVPVDGEVAIETRAPLATAGTAPPIQNREPAPLEAGAAVAPAKQTLHDKLRGTRERFVAERAESTYLRGLLREYRGRLTRTDTALAKSAAAERQLAAMFGGYEERLQAQLAHHAERVRRQGIPAAAAARAAQHAATSHDYAAAVSQWREGGPPGATQSAVVAGLPWWTPANGDDPVRSPQLLPLGDLAAVRQFVVGGIMLDVGAGTGEAVIPRVLLGDFAMAYAAEPDADRFMCLVGNTLDTHLEGRVLPDRIAIGNSTGGAGREPAVTLEAWVERLGVPADEIRFVRISARGAEPAVLQGAGALLRQDIVWQIAVRPGAGADQLAALIAAHFTHVQDLDDQIEGVGRPASEAEAVLRSRSDAGRCANLLLFNLG